MTEKIVRFNLKKYLDRQTIEAITCPVNRHATRVAHNCDDWELFKHPKWLLENIIQNGGAAAFAKRRNEFLQEVEIYLIEFEI